MATSNPIADLAQQVALLTQTNAELVVTANDAIALANQYATAAGVSAGQAAAVLASSVKTVDLSAPSTVGAWAFSAADMQAIVDNAVPKADYAALRAYSSRSGAVALGVRITGPGIAGFFWMDSSDASTADNGGTVIVDALGRRWKRLFNGAVLGVWFGGVWDGATDVAAVAQAALDSGAKVVDFLNLPARVNASLTIPVGVKLVNANLTSGTAGMKAVLVSTRSGFQGSIVGTGYAGASNEWGIYPNGDGVTDVSIDATVSNVSVAMQVFTTGATPPARWKGVLRASGLVGGGSQSNGYALALFKANDCEFVLYAQGTPRHDVYISSGASRNRVVAFSKACGGAPVQLASFFGQPFCESNSILAFVDAAAPIVGNTADPFCCNMVGLVRDNNLELYVTNSPTTNGALLFRANAVDVYPYRNYAKVFHTGGYAGATGLIRSDSGVDNTVELYGSGQASAGAGTALISAGVYSSFIPVEPGTFALRIAGLSWDAEGTNIRGVAALASYAPVDIGPGYLRAFKNSLGARVYISGGGTVIGYTHRETIKTALQTIAAGAAADIAVTYTTAFTNAVFSTTKVIVPLASPSTMPSFVTTTDALTGTSVKVKNGDLANARDAQVVVVAEGY